MSTSRSAADIPWSTDDLDPLMLSVPAPIREHCYKCQSRQWEEQYISMVNPDRVTEGISQGSEGFW